MMVKGVPEIPPPETPMEAVPAGWGGGGHVAEKTNGLVLRGAVSGKLWPSLGEGTVAVKPERDDSCQPESPSTGRWDRVVASSPAS